MKKLQTSKWNESFRFEDLLVQAAGLDNDLGDLK